MVRIKRYKERYIVVCCIEFDTLFTDEACDEIDDSDASEVLSYGLMYLEFCDSMREGDGLRILRCWRYLMLFFKANKGRIIASRH